MFAVSTPDWYSVSRAGECRLFSEGKVFICSPHTRLCYCRSAREHRAPGSIRFQWKEHQKCYFERDTLQKNAAQSGFGNSFYIGKNKSNTIIFGSWLYKGSFASKSFKRCKERLKGVGALTANLFRGKMSCCVDYHTTGMEKMFRQLWFAHAWCKLQTGRYLSVLRELSSFIFAHIIWSEPSNYWVSICVSWIR